ncbi:hypothetical protein AMS68_005406 [Peltaster fructicola]|uniref:AP-3 complex subunit delta n=1 Tax=Peltaster fructicola TaxID=286661 RepID=A0A6H0XZ48_9PEZI|nr:hypothetical protein AMS68_005406 [Peltaster fructicola]
MFEKDVLQLIRGLRAHKGQEREYIQSALRECRKEIKSQDMDIKAIALLKLVYLEMFGHDMSWASFNVLEVMSSQKFLQKRVGYLAAVQTFRPDTEVLMLAENLLKKDLGNTDKNTISLTLSTIPHVINPSMANSLLIDLLPRMSHSNPTIRKKTIVTLYRLAVVYPEVLRPAWPKIRERLLDENEDTSVTAAIVNVVCELGWRRPHDFLPLAPRFFDLLTQSKNNWMGIKIIKLFSVLTPIEPRLVKKLLPPLTELIKTTPAMSLLYECINGIIQGGIMEAAQGTTEGDDIARLCVSKLRGMLVVQNDPNLRFVALIAFTNITSSHAELVAEHQDVILECIDDPDVSIRTRALDLVIGMVNVDNLQRIVDRLVKQLQISGVASASDDPDNDRGAHSGIEPLAEDGDEDETSVRAKSRPTEQAPPLPNTYRALVIERILEMCTKDMYANMADFEWYIDVLASLVRQIPSSNADDGFTAMSERIGGELLNVTVRVKAIRPEALAAAQALLSDEHDDTPIEGSRGALTSAAFIAGEYATLLPDPDLVLTSLLRPANSQLPAKALAVYVQAIPKIFVALTGDERQSWSTARCTQITLLIARITHFLEPLTLHPSLDVQERSVEYLELFRLANEASAHHLTSDDEYAEPPLLLTQAIPALFAGMELNPVAAVAITQVPTPEGLDLDTPINSSLQMILQQADYDTDVASTESTDVRQFYYEKPTFTHTTYNQNRPAAEVLEDNTAAPSQMESARDPEAAERTRLAKRERHKDDPYYIDSGRNSGASTPLGSILRSATSGEQLDVDAIPVMELVLDHKREPVDKKHKPVAKKKPQRRYEITTDETLPPLSITGASTPTTASSKTKKSLLQVDSSGLSTLSLEASDRPLDVEQRAREDEEMARAIKEVERLRLAMQRRTEGIQEVDNGEGVIVKSRRKKARTGLIEQEPNADEAGPAPAKEEKERRKPKLPSTTARLRSPKPRRKKKRVVALDGGS